ncbi:MAG TPA: histidine kinase [Solirubrobacterales bacterium]|nr:histidine kinase [Solirubrobacterales bacterium]
MAAGATAVALAGSGSPYRGAEAALNGLTIAILFAVGIYAARRDGEGRFGQVLILCGAVWFLAGLSTSDVGWLYSVGRVFAWVFEALVVYAFLSYPTGRLQGRPERVVFALAVGIVLFLYLPTTPLVAAFPVPSPYSTCTAHCPGNSFFAGSEPGFVHTVVRPLREAVTFVVYFAVAALLAVRLSQAGRNLRRTLAPVTLGAGLRFFVAGGYVALRLVGVGDDVLQVVALVWLVTLPIAALGFLVGLLQWRVFAAGALARLTTGLGDAYDPLRLRSLLAASLGEDRVEVFYALPREDTWRDQDAAAREPPAEDAGRCVIETRGDSGLRAAVACGAGFRDHPEFMRAIGSCALSALEHERLNHALDASLRDVQASRKRLATTAFTARREIERDLHDGAQQQLVTLRVRLELAREQIGSDPSAGPEIFDGLGLEVEEIIEEVRALARGIYPPLLASEGLGDALRAAARRSAQPVVVDVDGVGRHSAEIEAAVYFCCLEAMQNAAKHAGDQAKVEVRVRRDGEILGFDVGDDGRGFDAEALDGDTSGVPGMRDRLDALGGTLTIISRPGAGTSVSGSVPVDPG